MLPGKICSKTYFKQGGVLKFVTPSVALLIASFIFIVLGASCATTTYDREFYKVEDLYYAGKYEEAAGAVRELARSTGSRELLLYSMEAGIVFHSMGDYDASDRAFQQAWDISQSISRSKLEDVASFWLNETDRKFIGQNFERVLIGYYRVLNQLARGNRENAKVLFRQIDAELRDMKYYDDFYKQNAVVRYLDALVSLSLGDYNDTRAQLKNLSTLFPSWQKEWDRLSAVLAVEENNADDQAATAGALDDVLAFNEKGERVTYRPGMAQLVILNSAGKSAVKTSRGTLAQTPELMRSFQVSLEANRRVRRSMGQIENILSNAENPMDIRCWRFLPDNYQISVVYLESGNYELEFVPQKKDVLVSSGSRKITVRDGDFHFISLQSMSKDRRVYTLAK